MGLRERGLAASDGSLLSPTAHRSPTGLGYPSLPDAMGNQRDPGSPGLRPSNAPDSLIAPKNTAMTQRLPTTLAFMIALGSCSGEDQSANGNEGPQIGAAGLDDRLTGGTASVPPAAGGTGGSSDDAAPRVGGGPSNSAEATGGIAGTWCT